MLKQISLLLALLAILPGCGTAEQRLVGKWKGRVSLAQPAQSSPLGHMARGVAGMLDPQLDLKPDHTFSLYISVLQIEGSWALEGDTLVLQPTKYAGMNPAEVKESLEQGVKRLSDKDAPPFAKELANQISGDAPKPGEPIRLTLSQDGEQLKMAPGQAGTIGRMGELVFKKV